MLNVNTLHSMADQGVQDLAFARWVGLMSIPRAQVNGADCQMNDLTHAMATEKVDTLKQFYSAFFGARPKLTRKEEIITLEVLD